MVVKVKDAKTTRKQIKCSAYDNTKKSPSICVACNCFCSWRKVKAESEAERLVITSYKNIYSMLETTEKTGKKKHDKNEREDWRTVGELLINPLSFTQLAQSHGVCGFPAARSLADLHIFCWKSSCRLLEYKQTFFGVVVLVFVRFFQPVCDLLCFALFPRLSPWQP